MGTEGTDAVGQGLGMRGWWCRGQIWRDTDRGRGCESTAWHSVSTQGMQTQGDYGGTWACGSHRALGDMDMGTRHGPSHLPAHLLEISPHGSCFAVSWVQMVTGLCCEPRTRAVCFCS